MVLSAVGVDLSGGNPRAAGSPRGFGPRDDGGAGWNAGSRLNKGHKAATGALFLFFAVAGLVFGGHALWQKWVLGVRRAHVPDVFNAIVFGDLALLLGVLAGCLGC